MNIDEEIRKTMQSMCWQSIRDDISISDEELFNKFNSLLKQHIPPHVIEKIINATKTENTLTYDSGEINIDTGEIYLYLKNSNSVSLIEKEGFEIDEKIECENLVILFETNRKELNPQKDPKIFENYAKKISEKVRREYTFSMKKSDKDFITLIILK